MVWSLPLISHGLQLSPAHGRLQGNLGSVVLLMGEEELNLISSWFCCRKWHFSRGLTINSDHIASASLPSGETHPHPLDSVNCPTRNNQGLPSAQDHKCPNQTKHQDLEQMEFFFLSWQGDWWKDQEAGDIKVEKVGRVQGMIVLKFKM